MPVRASSTTSSAFRKRKRKTSSDTWYVLPTSPRVLASALTTATGRIRKMSFGLGQEEPRNLDGGEGRGRQDRGAVAKKAVPVLCGGCAHAGVRCFAGARHNGCCKVCILFSQAHYCV